MCRFINPLPAGPLLSNIGWGGAFHPTPPPSYDFALRVEIDDCDTCN